MSEQTQQNGRTEQRVAVITAGGSGMGAETARRLVADGYRVAVLSSSGRGEALGKELGGIGVTGSNQSPDDLQRLVDLTMERWGRVDALVNSAGHGPRAQILEISDDDWHRGIDTYFLSAVRPTRLVTPIMERQGGGSIVNISTAWAFEPKAMFPTSAVARAGLASFTKIFADAYGPAGIRMNNVLPGWIHSNPESDVDEERRDSTSLKRYGTNAEIAATVAFLVSDGAGYITGQNIRVDGGVTAGVR